MADSPLHPHRGEGVESDPSAAHLNVLKALADPVRLRILHEISRTPEGSLCACSMPEAFGVSQPTVSHHLKRLVEAGILERRMRGNWAHFSIRPGAFAPLLGLLAELDPDSASPGGEPEPCDPPKLRNDSCALP